MNTALRVVPYGLAVFVVAVALTQVVLLVSASLTLRRTRQRERHVLWRRMLSSPLTPKVSVIVPAFNEEASIRETVRGLLALVYPNLEIVVVNDGSTDGTIDALVDEFDLSPVHPVYRRALPTKPVHALYRSSVEPRLVVVDKENGHKSDTLNAGLNISTGDLVCAIDADTLVAPNALQHLVTPFLVDERTVAVGGTVRLTNGSAIRNGRVLRLRAPRQWLAGIQTVEYLRAFLVGRVGWNPLGGNLIISGAFGLFRRDVLLAIGGYETGAIGEDMELIVRMRRLGYESGSAARVEFTPDPVAWTQAPEKMRVLARQRNRWHRGLLDVLVRHRAMIGRPRYGTAGLVGLPYFLLIEAIAPIVELVWYAVLLVGLLRGAFGFGSLGVVLAAYAFSALATLAVVIFEEAAFHEYSGVRDRALLAWYCIIEQLVYRPCTVVWRLWGFVLWARGRSEWGNMERTGFGRAT